MESGPTTVTCGFTVDKSCLKPAHPGIDWSSGFVHANDQGSKLGPSCKTLQLDCCQVCTTQKLLSSVVQVLVSCCPTTNRLVHEVPMALVHPVAFLT